MNKRKFLAKLIIMSLSVATVVSVPVADVYATGELTSGTNATSTGDNSTAIGTWGYS